MRAKGLLVLGAFIAAACPAALPGADGGTRTVLVGSEGEFDAAVAALRDSGGTIALAPHAYRELVVPERSTRPLRIVGAQGVRVERIVLDHTQRVSVDRVTIAPLARDAAVDLRGSREIELNDLLVTAQGTPYSASVLVPDSSGVTIRRSTFTHCGDRSPSWSNCLLLSEGARAITVEDSWFHDCYGCDFVHGRWSSGLTLRRNRFERTLPCRIGRVRCGHQDLVEMFSGRGLLVEDNYFGVYRMGGAQLYLTNAIDHVRIANNVFIGTDPRVPGYHSRVALIVGSRGYLRVPHDVRIVNNTILTGAVRVDGYAGSIRMSSMYAAVPRSERPVLANNVIGLLDVPGHVCAEAQTSSANVVVSGQRCSAADVVGDPGLDASGRPTASSTLLIDSADPRYATSADITGRPRRGAPDIGAYEFAG